MPNKVWDEITYPFPNFIMDVITYTAEIKFNPS